MKKMLSIVSVFFILASCATNYNDKVGAYSDPTYSKIESAINCFEQTLGEKTSRADERMLLIAFVNKDLEVKQKLGWRIINDQDIVKMAKKNYALVTIAATEHKLLNNECSYDIVELLKSNQDKTLFVIANQELCVFGNWTLDDAKENIIEKLGIGNGP